MSSSDPTHSPPKRRMVTPSFDGTRIVWDLYLNEASTRAFLLVPGFWRHREHPAILNFARRLLGFGSVAAMDIRGHGESGGAFTFNRDEYRDAAIVARELLRETGAARIDPVGLSMGGAITVTAIARHPELPWGKALLISPVANVSRIRPFLNPFTAHRHLAASQALRTPRIDVRAWAGEKIRAEDEAPRVSIPVIIVHVKGDWLVNDSHGARLHERCRCSVLHLLEIRGQWHADRIFSSSPSAIEPAIAAFLAE